MRQQATIGARAKNVIEADGLQFKDLNGNGILDPYEDWRLTPAERAADLVSRMTPEEKIGLMVIDSRTMGITQKRKDQTSHDGILDEFQGEGLRFGHPQKQESTTEQIEQKHMRHFIVREVTKGSHLARWVNTMNEVAEATRLGIPVIVASNSRNERGSVKIAVQKDDQDFTQWPGTLGLAATGDLDLIYDFARKSRLEFDAANIKKGYMYMADVATDPRWFRFNGTLGEDPEFIARAITCLIKGFQGDEIDSTSIALTTKHFPGGGARENGFDPHYAEGKYNCYPTGGSLEKYHLPPFKAAIAAGTASIMPYYAIPSNSKSVVPQAPLTEPFEEVGFAFNQAIIQGMLRDAFGYQGYINSDTGIMDNMAWGVEDLDAPQRAAKAINAGVDVISGTTDVKILLAAYERGLVSDERLSQSAERLVIEMFQLGLFENPYREPAAADEIIDCAEHREAAYKAHQKSVVLLKNRDSLLPLTPEKLAGKKIYLELFEKDLLVSKLDQFRADLQRLNAGIEFTTDYHFADIAILFLNPRAGEYFRATESLLELNICEKTHVNVAKVQAIRDSVPQVVLAVNFMLPWLLTNVEPLADSLLAGFETYETAIMDVIFGRFSPTGRMPITLPGSDAAIAVDENGVCASPNDVPGFEKEKYMAGKPYDYVDTQENKYRLGFGLSY